jgi:hypothetical protein
LKYFNLNNKLKIEMIGVEVVEVVEVVEMAESTELTGVVEISFD